MKRIATLIVIKNIKKHAYLSIISKSPLYKNFGLKPLCNSIFPEFAWLYCPCKQSCNVQLRLRFGQEDLKVDNFGHAEIKKRLNAKVT